MQGLETRSQETFDLFVSYAHEDQEFVLSLVEHLQGQDLDITGLPAGIYYLTQDADPDNHWLETRDDNNRSWVKFALTRHGANPGITILETYGYFGNTSNK